MKAEDAEENAEQAAGNCRSRGGACARACTRACARSLPWSSSLRRSGIFLRRRRKAKPRRRKKTRNKTQTKRLTVLSSVFPVSQKNFGAKNFGKVRSNSFAKRTFVIYCLRTSAELFVLLRRVRTERKRGAVFSAERGKRSGKKGRKSFVVRTFFRTAEIRTAYCTLFPANGEILFVAIRRAGSRRKCIRR